MNVINAIFNMGEPTRRTHDSNRTLPNVIKKPGCGGAQSGRNGYMCHISSWNPLLSA